jgi:hypothetical protein
LLNLISRLGQILIVHHFLVNPIVCCNVKLLHHLAILLDCASDVVGELLGVALLPVRVVIISVLVVGRVGRLVVNVLLQKIPVFFLWGEGEARVDIIEWK